MRAEYVKKVNKDTLQDMVKKFIDLGKSMLITDDNVSYRKMNELLPHRVVPHKAHFAIGNIHTNHIENFWSIVKRGITGIYQHLSEKYLDSYITEFAYKYNHRKENKQVFFFNTLHKMV